MNNTRDLDYEWLTHSLGMDARYIAQLVLEGKQEQATEYIHRTDYVNRMNQWKAGRP